MAALTLTEARTTVGQLLDDPNNRQWSTTQIDFALRSALSRCLVDYVGAGGERFDEQGTGTSSASDGTLSLTSTPPLMIRHVTIDVSDTFIPIRAATKRDKFRADTTARSLVYVFVRELALPSTTSHPLVGNGATAANTWDAFDMWVVARAALQLATKEDKLSSALAALETDLRASCTMRARIPAASEWPRQRGAGSAYDLLRWTWLPASNQLQLCNVGGAFY